MNTAATALNREQSPDGTQRQAGKQSPQLKSVATVSGSGRRGGRRVYEYKPGSWWSHLLFGMGTLAFMTVPALMPGVTSDALIKGYLGFLLASYGVVCIWGIFRALHKPAGRMSARH